MVSVIEIDNIIVTAGASPILYNKLNTKVRMHKLNKTREKNRSILITTYFRSTCQSFRLGRPPISCISAVVAVYVCSKEIHRGSSCNKHGVIQLVKRVQ